MDNDDYLPDDVSPLQWEPDPDTHCWLWTESVLNGKYVRYRTRNGEREYLHRIIARNKYGDIAPWQRVAWTCGNSRCINAEHIVLIDKEKAVPAKRKLTDAQVLEILADPRPYRVICKAFDISYSLVDKIKRGERRMLKNKETGNECPANAVCLQK